MAHYTVFVVLHDDGFTQQFVGNPKNTREKAEHERQLLAIDDGYDINELSIVEVPA